MRIPALLLLFLLALGASAQRARADGYLLTLRHDSLPCTILLPRDFNGNESDASFAQGVEVLGDSATRRYAPHELAGFGFRQRLLQLHYHALASEDNPVRRFVRVLRTGPRLTLLAVPQWRSNGPLRNQDMGARAGEIPRAQVYLQDAAGRVLLLDNTMGRGELRRLLRAFLHDTPALEALAASEVQAFRDLDDFVLRANGANL